MKEEKINSYEYEKYDSFDIIPYLKSVWAGRNLVLKFTGIFFIIGILAALNSPIIYESQITFVPQTSDNLSTAGSGYAKIASLAGINLKNESSLIDNYISPLLYSKIFESDEFSMDLLKEKIIFLDGNELSVKEYLLAGSKRISLLGLIKSFLGFIEKYTIGLFRSSLDKDAAVVSNEILKKYNFIDQKDYQLIKSLKSKFSVEVNKDDGYISVLGMDKDPFVSTQLVNLITKNLQSRIISLRTSKIKEQLEYSKEEYKIKQDEFQTLQNKLAEFRDSNKSISTAVFMSKLQILESEYLLQQTILTSLASEYNSNKIKLNKDTPIFSVLDEVSVPNQRSEPNRKKIVLIYIFLGIIISTAYLMVINPLKEFIERIKK